jgi:two-component system LytT family response regulator
MIREEENGRQHGEASGALPNGLSVARPGDPAAPIRCFVVDDERLARIVVRSQLERHQDTTVVGEASDLPAAVSGIRSVKPEVVFLDIGMQEHSGFDLLPALGKESPLIVFVTAYDQYAVRAFDVRAVDYLVKPIEPGRFDEAMNRLRERLRPARDGTPSVPSEEPLFVQAGKGGCWISPRDIAFIQSDRNYSSVTLTDGKGLIVRQTMAVWRRKLPQPGFLQVDRTLIVNLHQIRRTDFSGHSGLVYFMPGAAPLTLGRQATGRLRDAMAPARSGVATESA